MITPSNSNAFIFLYFFICSAVIPGNSVSSCSVDAIDSDVKYPSVSDFVNIAVLGCSISIFTFLPGLKYTDSK